MANYFIGVDIGTTSTKSILFDENGKVVCKAIKEYPINSEKNLYRTQNPDEILDAVVNTISDIVMKSNATVDNISFISFSAMMHSIIAIDSEGNALTDSIIWADCRSVDYVEKFKENKKGKEFYLRTGTPCHPMSPLYKIMWIKDNMPDIYNNTHKFISIKEYVFYKFFNKYVVDYSIASASGMFNIFNLKWDNEILKVLGIDESKLSTPVKTTYCLNKLKDEYCKKTRLNSNTTFVIGASDGCLANLGANAIERGVAVATIGTSGAVRVIFDEPVTDEKERVFCYVLTENKYVVGGAINNGGIIYRWFRDNFSELEVMKAKELGLDSYDLINEYIEKTDPGSNGLLCLPFLAGERAPYWNANLRGAFLGISDMHKKNHFARAIIEGICYGMEDVFKATKELVGEVNCVYANGGFTRSKEWVQILCDVMDTKVIIGDNYESSCLGAIMLGMLAVGRVSNLEDCSYLIGKTLTYEARDQNVKSYKELFEIYTDTISKITPILERLTCYQKN